MGTVGIIIFTIIILATVARIIARASRKKVCPECHTAISKQNELENSDLCAECYARTIAPEFYK